MFSIRENPFGPCTEYRLTNDSTGEYVAIIPALGAVLNQVALSKNGKVYELLEGSESYEAFIMQGRSNFRGSKLFPFPNRVADGTYTFEGKEYHLPVNFPHEKNSIHGIVLEENFELVKKEAFSTFAVLILQHQTLGTEEGYPFKIVLTIEYLLDKEGFTCRTTVHNNDRQNIPVGDGWHPYFKTGSKIDDCFLALPVERSYEVDKRMIPTGKTVVEKLFDHASLIGSHDFDTGYQLKKSGLKILSTTLYDPSHNITLRIWQESGEGRYDYLQVYIPPDRRSIAIEPMSCLADAFNNKEGLIILKPDENRIFSFGLKLE